MVSRPNHTSDRVFFAITLVFALILCVRIVFILVSATESEIKTYHDPVVSTQVVRGTITDRNGRILAMETPYWSCALLLKSVKDLQSVANLIADPLHMDPEQIIEITKHYSSYALIKRYLSDDERAALSEIIARHNLGSVVIEKRYGRSFPQHYHAAQIIGFTNADNQGIEGLELQYNDILSPYPSLDKQVTYGNDIQLTLDMDIQYLLDGQAVEIDSQHFGDYVIGIIMGAKTGEILAATTFPWYDPNSYQTSSIEQRQNRIVTYMYEPGSVFKVFSLASVLQANQADVSTVFHCDGSFTFHTAGGTPVTINCVSAHGDITPSEMIKFSCNGAIANWALQTEDTLFRSTLEALHFGSTWNIGLRGEIRGLLQPASSWSGRSKPTIAFGQEIGVTALQMASAATAIANKGVLVSPSIIRSVHSHDGKVNPDVVVPRSTTRVLSETTAENILHYMETATEPGGTARLTAIEGVRIASKTGTAQILDEETNSYDSSNFLASTLSIFPVEDPQYIVYIAVVNPKGSTIWGSNIAGPAIAQIIKGLLRQGKLFSDTTEKIML